MRTHLLCAVAALAPLAAGAADPAGTALTVFGGYRGGGSFTETTSGRAFSLDSTSVWSVTVDRAIDASREVQLFVSSQDTGMLVQPAAGPGTRVPLRTTYLHFGGTNFFEGPVGVGPYVAGGLGATFMDPGTAGLSSEMFFSFSVGVGYLWPLARNVALRAEARGYVTWITGEGALFCSGGCVVSVRGDVFTQGDVQLGLTVRF